MSFIQSVIQGTFDEERVPKANDRSKQTKEAIERLSTLKELLEFESKG